MYTKEEKCLHCLEMFDSRVGGYINEIRACDRCISKDVAAEECPCDDGAATITKHMKGCIWCEDTQSLALNQGMNEGWERRFDTQFTERLQHDTNVMVVSYSLVKDFTRKEIERTRQEEYIIAEQCFAAGWTFERYLTNKALLLSKNE